MLYNTILMNSIKIVALDATKSQAPENQTNVIHIWIQVCRY